MLMHGPCMPSINEMRPDATDGVDKTNDGDTTDQNADVIDETVALEAANDGIALDDKNVEDTSEEKTKNRDPDDSEETKA